LFAGALLPAVNVFVAGILFAMAYYITGNLWLPIAIHFTWNLLLGPVLGLTVSGQNQLNSGWQILSIHGPNLWTGGTFGIEGGLMVTIITVIILSSITILFKFTRKNIKNK
jgi:hypothetical protein